MAKSCLSYILVRQYEWFQVKSEQTAPENMVAWLRSAGRTRTKSLAPFDDAFEERGLNLKEELDGLADLLVNQIGEEQINAILDDEPRDNDKIKKEFRRVAHFLNFATEVTARFE